MFIWQVSYRLGEDSNLGSKFRVEPNSGEICLASALDHEQESAYDLTVVAVDRVSSHSKNRIKGRCHEKNRKCSSHSLCINLNK